MRRGIGRLSEEPCKLGDPVREPRAFREERCSKPDGRPLRKTQAAVKRCEMDFSEWLRNRECIGDLPVIAPVLKSKWPWVHSVEEPDAVQKGLKMPPIFGDAFALVLLF